MPRSLATSVPGMSEEQCRGDVERIGQESPENYIRKVMKGEIGCAGPSKPL